ncbi:class II aldolase/adducin family protein [Zeimonas arvi]|uniref:Class II aldolase/adducin family protein n=1 Tax=Zeimonas arvi TaxID=2498847 RepID=A0A5C8P178_9BURK|nr:class II aldolase/adducin family protein [Zeimonas arvi]TXL67098.1 class II aldolase/adducin family protein [Zeimonas arvi]
MNAPQKSIREKVSAEEWQLRIDLAACYRAVAMYGWDDLVFTHISARIPGPEHHFLINPYGMMFEEITASSLVKVDMDCRPLSETPYPVNPAGFVIHSAIHAAREDVVCVLHTHTPAGVAVAAQKQGLLPISQQASVALMSLSYHDYEGIAVRDDEKARLQADLGTSMNFILRNHGLLTVGQTVADAFLAMFNLERACQVQVLAQSGGAELARVTPEVLGAVGQALSVQRVGQATPGALAWPALLRKLDRVNPGYDA